MSATLFRRAAVGLGALLAVTLGQAGVASAASGDYGPHVFTAADPSFAAVDNNGSFTGRVNFITTGAGSNPMGWSFQVSPSVQAISTSLMTCQTFVSGDQGYQDFHPDIPMYYVLHSTVPNNPLGYYQNLAGTCTFDVQGGGKAVLNVKFAYVVDNAGIGNRAPAAGPVMDSDLEISYPS